MTPITNDKEYREALARVDELMTGNLASGTPEGEEFHAISLLISDYEDKKFPIEAEYDPVDVILFFMQQNNLRQTNMVKYFGTRPRTSEVLARKRKLTLPMIRNLHKGLGIPLTMLVSEYDLEPDAAHQLS